MAFFCVGWRGGVGWQRGIGFGGMECVVLMAGWVVINNCDGRGLFFCMGIRGVGSGSIGAVEDLVGLCVWRRRGALIYRVDRGG